MAQEFGSQYSEKVMEHFRNPRNVGVIENPSGIGHVGNPVCVLKDTILVTNSAVRPIEIVEEAEKVLSHDGFYHTVIKTHCNDYNGNVYKIDVHNLGDTITTPEHHILGLKTHSYDHKYRNYKKLIVDWYAAEELVKGDTVLYPIPRETRDLEYVGLEEEIPKYDFKSRKLPKIIKIDNRFLRLAGYYLAEGYVRLDKCKGTLGFVFGKGEDDYVAEVIKTIREVFGIPKSTVTERRNAINICVYSARLARFFGKNFGKGAKNKKMPHWMTLLPTEKQQHIILGLWRGDGYINNKGAKFVTVSKVLAFQLKGLLLRQKLIFSFLTVPKKGIHAENYHIYVKEKTSLKKLSEICQHTIRFEKARIKYPKKSWYDDNFFYCTIAKKSCDKFKGKVYNLHVEKPHSYVSNSLALHNCGDIMELYIKVKDDTIIDAKFKTFGCGAAIATSSMVTELVKGKTVKEALKISNKAVAEALGGLPPIKMHCSLLAEQALKGAIDDYLKKSGKSA